MTVTALTIAKQGTSASTTKTITQFTPETTYNISVSTKFSLIDNDTDEID